MSTIFLFLHTPWTEINGYCFLTLIKMELRYPYSFHLQIYIYKRVLYFYLYKYLFKGEMNVDINVLEMNVDINVLVI